MEKENKQVDSLQEASEALKGVKDELNSMASEITDEMRLEQAKLETSLRKDGSDAILKPETSINKAEEIKQEYIQDSYKEYAKNNISSDEKTQDAYADFMTKNNQDNLQSKNSLETIDNAITASTVNSKEDFENHLDIKQSALEDVKSKNPDKTEELDKKIEDVKEIKEGLDKEPVKDKELEKPIESEQNADKDAGQESGFNGMDLMAESRESESAFDRGFAEAMDNWDKSIADERREEFDSSIER